MTGLMTHGGGVVDFSMESTASAGGFAGSFCSGAGFAGSWAAATPDSKINTAARSAI